MAHRREANEDAVTEEELTGTATQADDISIEPSKGSMSRRNAFAVLMNPKKLKRERSTSPPPTTPHHIISTPSPAFSGAIFTRSLGREGLGAYIASPDSFPPSRIIYHNSSFVAIRDLYPKSLIHFLLLPRDATKTRLHPFDALVDPVFLETVMEELAHLKSLAASELRRLLRNSSRSEAARNSALDADPPPSELPPGRDWSREIISGVHAVPSMRHLHIHVLSRDRYSPCMRHRKHYNSFNTPFLVPVDDFPLARDDPRLHPKQEGYLGWDMRCWRCGVSFGREFRRLKAHLEGEFEEWKKE